MNTPDDQHFLGLILSLQHSAWVCLGKIANPATSKTELNLPAAKDTIDLLVALEGKTKGNLGDDEGKLLSGILTELRLNYVDELAKDERKKDEIKKSESQASVESAGSEEPESKDAKEEASS